MRLAFQTGVLALVATFASMSADGAECSQQDQCSKDIIAVLGKNHNQTTAFMSNFSDIYNGDGDSACSTTQLLTSLLVGRDLQTGDIKRVLEGAVEQQYATMGNYITNDSYQPDEELAEVIKKLRATVLQDDENQAWKPAIAACYWINYDLGISHTFTLQRESKDAFRVWQSFVAQYDLFGWISQNVADRLQPNMDKPSAYGGVLTRSKMSEFITKLQEVSGDKVATWSAKDELHRELFWSPSGVTEEQAANVTKTILSLGCDYHSGYKLTDSCATGLKYVQEYPRQEATV